MSPLLSLILAIVGLWAGVNLSYYLLIFLTVVAIGIFLYVWATVGFRELSGLVTIFVLFNVVVFTVPMWVAYVYYENPGIAANIKTLVFRR